MNSPSVKTRTL